jgi:FtsP/CotA-like multicopper oxidase with cupredoxin domain
MRDFVRSGSARFVVIALVALAIGVVLGFVVGKDDKDAKPASTGPPKIGPAPFTAGMDFQEPPVVSSREVPGRPYKVLRTTILAQNGTSEISGIQVAETQTYGATGADGPRGFLGPTLRVDPGDEIEITLDNQLTVPEGAIGAACLNSDPVDHEHNEQVEAGAEQVTNLHFHGLHVTPREKQPYGDTVLVNLPNGKSRIRFRIPPTHDKGTFWYHAHRHECTDDQVFRGLAGLILVGDSRQDLPERFRDITTRSLALKDMQVEKAAGGDGYQVADNHDWGNPTHRTVNGLVNPKIAIRPGETQLWRLANVSSAVWYNVALVDPDGGEQDTFTVVAQDGNPLTEAVSQKAILIPPGRRFDLLVTGPGAGEQRILRTLRFDQGRLTFPEDDLATLTAEGDPAPAIALPTTLVPPAQQFPAKRGPNRRFTFDIDFRDANNPAFTINNDVFDADIPDAAPDLRTTERWTIYNKSKEWHPFHIHQDDFHVVDAGGGPQLPGDQDVVPLPPGTPENPSKVVIDMPFTDYSGNFLFHCHILDHEDAGMMSRVEVDP